MEAGPCNSENGDCDSGNDLPCGFTEEAAHKQSAGDDFACSSELRHACGLEQATQFKIVARDNSTEANFETVKLQLRRQNSLGRVHQLFLALTSWWRRG